MKIYEYLRKMPEPMPCWLRDFSAGQAFNRDAFFASRVVYYPGSGADGHPVKLFGSTGRAHSFVYVDTKPWSGFTQVHDVHGLAGGMHLQMRYLYERGNASMQGVWPGWDDGNHIRRSLGL